MYARIYTRCLYLLPTTTYTTTFDRKQRNRLIVVVSPRVLERSRSCRFSRNIINIVITSMTVAANDRHWPVENESKHVPTKKKSSPPDDGGNDEMKID